MKDIDFDELDKAVNSLMSTAEETNATPEAMAAVVAGTPVSEVETPVAVEPALTAPPAVAVSNPVQVAPSVVTPAVAEEIVVSPALVSSAPKPSLATKRSGRFMDVVHPSSDMLNAEKPTMPTRTGATLNLVSSEANLEPVQPVSSGTVAKEVTSETEPEESVESLVMPDPIDAQMQMEQSSIVAKETNTVTDEELEQAMADELTKNLGAITDSETKPKPENVEEDQAELEQPQASPFIADAKVEKRPLGSPASVVETALVNAAVDNEDESVDSPEATQDEEIPVSTEAYETPNAILPEELNQDITAIEATIPTEEPESAPAKVTNDSIVPQYKEKADAVLAQHDALYDSAAHGAPLTHPAKKKSGWLWVLWIVLLITLGAGGAAALYYFKVI
jgi:hypothetical protein